MLGGNWRFKCIVVLFRVVNCKWRTTVIAGIKPKSVGFPELLNDHINNSIICMAFNPQQPKQTAPDSKISSFTAFHRSLWSFLEHNHTISVCLHFSLVKICLKMAEWFLFTGSKHWKQPIFAITTWALLLWWWFIAKRRYIKWLHLYLYLTVIRCSYACWQCYW